MAYPNDISVGDAKLLGYYVRFDKKYIKCLYYSGTVDV
jgi:hypothetical protein